MKANVFVAAALAACLCLSACSRQQSNSGSSADEISSSGSEAQNSGSEPGSEEVPSDESGSTEQGDLLSADEIAGIFKDLDARSAEIVDEWVNRDYTQIPIDGVPTHILENAVIGVRGVENENGSGFVPVYGTAVFAKVTEDTLPGFPWESTEEIYAAITDVYESVSASFGLEELIADDPKQQLGIFYQFDDGLYFRTSYIGYVRDLNWDYSSIKILENTPNKVQVQMCEIGENSSTATEFPPQRGIVKDADGNWVLTEIQW